MNTTEAGVPTREEADAEFAALLREAERGRLDAADLRRCDELRPHVSGELIAPFGRRQ